MNMFRIIWLLILMLLLPAVSPALQVSADAPDYAIPSGHFYTQAVPPGTPTGYGHTILDGGTDTSGQPIRFWSEFQQLGGVQALGYPTSERFMLDGFWTQATQRVLMQWRPEVGRVYFVNVFDKLHDMGLDPQLQASKQIPAQLDDNGPRNAMVDIVRYRQSWLDANPALKNFYFSSTASPLQFYGLPTSHVDTSNGAFDIIRLQRVVIQYWKITVPNIAYPGLITVALGGDIAKDFGLVPAPASQAIPPAGMVPPGGTGAAPCLPAITQSGDAVQVCATNALSTQITYITVYGRLILAGKPVPGAIMNTVWHFKTVTETCSGSADPVTGIASCGKDIGSMAAGNTLLINIDVNFSYNGHIYPASTSFLFH